MFRKLLHTPYWLPLILLILVGVNWLASQWHTRIDLTNEKRFTLSNATKKLLRNIDEPVTAEVFLKGDFPSGFRQLSSAAEDLLREFKEVGGSNIRYRFLAPDANIPGTEFTYTDSLTAMGLAPINLTSRLKEGQQQQLVYPYALLHYKDRTLPVQLFTTESKGTAFEILNNEQSMMEYRVADGISRIMQTEKTVVGYLTGNGEPQDYRSYDLAQNFLKNNYQLFVFDINNPGPIPMEFGALIVVKPTLAFSEESKFKLDQYVMNGGKLIMFIDRLNAEMDSLQIKNEVCWTGTEIK
ncbi:MAG: Gldg family protein [Ferruginibacter sp.]